MYYDYEYEELNVSDVTTVSQLRHFINCTSHYKELADWFNTDIEMIDKIYNNFKGRISVKNIIQNYDVELAKYTKSQEEYEERQQKINERNEILADQLASSRENFCGLGTRKVKLLLNKLAKTDDVAKAYRMALEIEDKNILAKTTQDKYGKYNDYTTKIYNAKYQLIKELISICKNNNYIFGYEKSDTKYPNSIMYFELPDMEQISFHVDLSDDELKTYPQYAGTWDRQENATLRKIENAINARYIGK